ncbi:pcaK, partial [Symbiodinium pilosum]
EKINDVGFGLYQVHVFILCAGAVVAEVTGLQTAAGLTSAIVQEYKIETDVGQEAQMLATYMGFALGTLSSGSAGDLFGRRLPVLLAYCGMLLSALGLFLTSSYEALCIGFSVFGFFGGLGIPAAFIALAEVCPTRLRGIVNAAMAVSFCCGEVWSALGFRLLLPDLIGSGWRSMLLWIGLPPLVLLCLGCLSPATRFDTPHFLSARGRRQELAQVMQLMATMNNREVSVEELAPAASEPGE